MPDDENRRQVVGEEQLLVSQQLNVRQDLTHTPAPVHRLMDSTFFEDEPLPLSKKIKYILTLTVYFCYFAYVSMGNDWLTSYRPSFRRCVQLLHASPDILMLTSTRSRTRDARTPF